jgi:hypothetical protein
VTPPSTGQRLAAFVRRRSRAAPGVLLYAQVTHVLGDAAIAAALATTLFFDVPVGEARTEVGLYLLLAFAPYAVLAPVVAPIVARRSRAHGAVVVVSDAGRAVLAVLLISRLDGPLLYPLGFGILVLSRTHGISRAALVPALADRDELLDANASISFVSGIAGSVGGLAALAVSAAAGGTAALLLAAAMYGAGTLSGLWLHPPAESGVDVEDKGWLTGTGSIRITVAVFAARVCLGFTAMLIAFSFHGGDDRLSLLLVGVSLGLGTWSASLIVPRLEKVISERRLAPAALIALVAAALIAVPVGGLAAGVVLAASVGLAGGTARLAFDAHVQQCWPPQARGPGYARYETLLQLGWVLGAAPGALIGVSLTVGAVIVASLALIGLVAAGVVVRALR